MGYFNFGFLNFAYRIWKSKKFRKFVIGFGFLAFVLSTIISNTTFAAQSDAEYTTDTTIAILEAYQRNVEFFVSVFNNRYNNPTYTPRYNRLFNLLNQSTFLYLRHYSIDNDNLNCLLYTRSQNTSLTQVTTNWLCDGPNQTYLQIPTTGYNVRFFMNSNINYNTTSFAMPGNVDISDFIPSVLMYRMPSEIVECMEKARLCLCRSYCRY